MGYPRHPSDYDPVAPRRRPSADGAGALGAPVEDLGHVATHDLPHDTLAPSRGVAADPARNGDAPAQTSDAATPRDPLSHPPGATPSSARARGHSLTFVGLFLFTVVVYLRPYELIDALSGFRSMAFWIAVCTLAVFFPTQVSLEGNLTARPREINLVLLLLLTGLLSIPLGQDPSRSWSAFVEFLKVVLMFIVIVNAVRTERRLKALILFALAVSCVLSVAGINDYLAGNLALQGRRIAGAIKGLFDNPNDLALHFVTMIPLAVALMLGTRKTLAKLLYGVCALLMVAGIVVTFSRGGFLGLITASLVLLWKISRRNRLTVCVLVALFTLPLLVALVSSSHGGRLSTASDDSAIARKDDLKRSIVVSIRHPLLGLGMDNYILYSNTGHATHNAYTQVSSEMGLAALAAYVLFIVAPFKGLRRIERETSRAARRPRFYYLAVGLQASLIGYMVNSFFASVAYVWYIYYLVGYAACLYRIYDASPEAAWVAAVNAGHVREADTVSALGQGIPFRESEALN
jgi:putative inorganic carbon (HCO3(-)) transporter